MALSNVVIEDAKIIFRNFEGKEGQYNREGDRNFCVLLEPHIAEAMANDGWNVKFLRPREEGEAPQPYVQVAVGFKGRPPKLSLITSKGRQDLDESSCILMDWAEIKSADVIIRPYEWSVSGNSGVKAYCKTLFIEVLEDYLELKYADVAYVNELESANTPLQLEGGYDDSDIVEGEIVED